MNHYPNQTPLDMHALATVVHRIFPAVSIQIEHVAEGVSTHVYRIVRRQEIFYLRVWPDAGESFAPEVAIHTQLRQLQARVPEVIHFEDCNDLLERSLMVTTEIKGQPISQSQEQLSEEQIRAIVTAAGRDLARINSLAVEGFGWVNRDEAGTSDLRAEWPTHRAFALEYWTADLAYLAGNVLQPAEIRLLEHVLDRYDSWLDVEQAQLAHGDLDATHIYQHQGQYSGIIDFGEIRGASGDYDAGHFHMRDGEQLAYPLLPALLSGYDEIVTLPADYEQRVRFTSLLINVRALARALQKRPPNRYTDHQLMRLRADLAALQ
ncbi:MAG: aminoglycoside phosphotransferase family protein [Ktedonobacteraceae bacterium]|nr:aminoglycoside phosphotransferase family protein [Ktedonobacteraceae bacterium]